MDPKCSFCGLDMNSVERMFRSKTDPNVFICDNCVEEFDAIMLELNDVDDTINSVVR